MTDFMYKNPSISGNNAVFEINISAITFNLHASKSFNSVGCIGDGTCCMVLRIRLCSRENNDSSPWELCSEVETAPIYCNLNGNGGDITTVLLNHTEILPLHSKSNCLFDGNELIDSYFYILYLDVVIFKDDAVIYTGKGHRYLYATDLIAKRLSIPIERDSVIFFDVKARHVDFVLDVKNNRPRIRDDESILQILDTGGDVMDVLKGEVLNFDHELSRMNVKMSGEDIKLSGMGYIPLMMGYKNKMLNRHNFIDVNKLAKNLKLSSIDDEISSSVVVFNEYEQDIVEESTVIRRFNSMPGIKYRSFISSNKHIKNIVHTQSAINITLNEKKINVDPIEEKEGKITPSASEYGALTPLSSNVNVIRCMIQLYKTWERVEDFTIVSQLIKDVIIDIIESINKLNNITVDTIETIWIKTELSNDPIEINITKYKKEKSLDDTNRSSISYTPEVQSCSSSLTESSPLEVTTSVPLAVEASSNYLSLKSRATPRDRGGREVSDGSSIMGMMEDGAKDVLYVTSGGKPVADLREAEGELNRGGSTPSGKTSGEESDGRISSGRYMDGCINFDILCIPDLCVTNISDLVLSIRLNIYNDIDKLTVINKIMSMVLKNPIICIKNIRLINGLEYIDPFNNNYGAKLIKYNTHDIIHNKFMGYNINNYISIDIWNNTINRILTNNNTIKLIEPQYNNISIQINNKWKQLIKETINNIKSTDNINEEAIKFIWPT